MGTYTHSGSSAKTINFTTISNYSDLTKDNFLLEALTINGSRLGGRNGSKVSGNWSNYGNTITKTYNSSTGILSISWLYMSDQGDSNGWISKFNIYYF